jgi:acyl-coenzyme A thioesterase 13
MTEITETNPRIDFLRGLIGTSMSQSPSPVARWLNGTLREVEQGKLVADYIVREDMTNPMGTLHGGTASMIMDDIVGTMVYSLGREYGYTSVNLNCDFLNPARVGEKLVATANVIRPGKNIVHCECSIVNAEGVIIAKCTTNLIQTGVRLPF